MIGKSILIDCDIIITINANINKNRSDRIKKIDYWIDRLNKKPSIIPKQTKLIRN
jgi:hypothetical protein